MRFHGLMSIPTTRERYQQHKRHSPASSSGFMQASYHSCVSLYGMQILSPCKNQLQHVGTTSNLETLTRCKISP